LIRIVYFGDWETIDGERRLLRFKSLTTGWGVIRLSFCFANDNQMTLPSDLQFEKNYKPDGVSSDCHLQMWTGWRCHPGWHL